MLHATYYMLHATCYTRTMIEANKIKLFYCPTYHQAADILTKPTDLLTFVHHRNPLMGAPSSI